MKAFAEGVILATGCVHMLWDAIKALNNPSLPEYWTKFPFTGIFFMVGLVLTLLLDVVGNRYMEQKQAATVVEDLENEGLLENDHDALITGNIEEQESETEVRRHSVVSLILEVGIVSHSVIVGLSLGVSQNPCEIRPLIVALCFHQFFEGFALGGSISQARFSTSKAIVMTCLFAVTMPSGVGIGTWLALGYNPNSPAALVVEGVLDSLSAGILIYTALHMIQADFGSNIMTSNSRLSIASFCMVLLGIGLMSSLAAWA